MKKMLQDEAVWKAQEEASYKQNQLTKQNLRKNKIRIEKDKMKRSPHNQRYLETLLKLKYHLEESYECYNFLAQDLKAEEEVSVAVGQLFALNQEKVAQAFLKQVCLIKGMDDIVKQQITLVEAANATPYGWNVAKHLEPEHGIFSEQDKANTKALSEVKA